ANCVHTLLSSTSDAPRALHPFPTRRSSDLLRRLFGSRGLVGTGHQHEERRLHLGDERLTPHGPAVEADAAADVLLLRRLVPGVGDRKSTRLNSSHRTISYAVFCLKKKKNYR